MVLPKPEHLFTKHHEAPMWPREGFRALTQPSNISCGDHLWQLSFYLWDWAIKVGGKFKSICYGEIHVSKVGRWLFLKPQLIIYRLTPWDLPGSKNSCSWAFGHHQGTLESSGEWHWVKPGPSGNIWPNQIQAPKIWFLKDGCDYWFPINYICKDILRVEIKWEPTRHIPWAYDSLKSYYLTSLVAG